MRTVAIEFGPRAQHEVAAVDQGLVAEGVLFRIGRPRVHPARAPMSRWEYSLHSANSTSAARIQGVGRMVGVIVGQR
jgi:hypothetical protein